MRSGTRTRSSGSSTSSGRRTTSTGPSWASSARRRSTARSAAASTGSTTRRSARRGGLFAISANVADRLRRFNGLEAEVLTPPPKRLPYRSGDYGDFVLSVGRLDRAKRVDLLVRAAASANGLRVVIAGDGPGPASGSRRSRSAEGVDGRVEFAGQVEDDAARRSVLALPRRVLRARRRGLRLRALRGFPLPSGQS